MREIGGKVKERNVRDEWQKNALCLYLHKFGNQVWVSGVILLAEKNDN